jgi:hypothetical protein
MSEIVNFPSELVIVPVKTFPVTFSVTEIVAASMGSEVRLSVTRPDNVAPAPLSIWAESVAADIIIKVWINIILFIM